MQAGAMPSNKRTCWVEYPLLCWLQGFRVREEAIDRIEEIAERDAQKQDADGNSIAFTVVAPSGVFKDYDRIFRCGHLLRWARHSM